MERGPRRDDLGLGAGQVTRHVDRVAPGVHRRPAGQRQLVADVLEHRKREAQARLDVLHRSERPLVEELAGSHEHRVVPVVERLHHHCARRHHGGHGARLVHVGGEGLLAQHVLSRRECGQCPPAVEPVGERVVHGVDVGVVDELFVRGDHTPDAVLAAKEVALSGSRAATATTSTSSTCRAGRITAARAILAAPSTPMRMGGIGAGYRPDGQA